MKQTLTACLSATAFVAALATPLQSSAQVQRSVQADIGVFVALPGDPTSGIGDNNLETSIAPLKFIFTSLPSGEVGRTYSPDFCSIPGFPRCRLYGFGFPLRALGGKQPYLWSWKAQVGSSLPPGLTLSKVGVIGNGCRDVPLPAICGTPTKAGAYKVSITVADSESPPHHLIGTYTIHIGPPNPPWFP